MLQVLSLHREQLRDCTVRSLMVVMLAVASLLRS